MPNGRPEHDNRTSGGDHWSLAWKPSCGPQAPCRDYNLADPGVDIELIMQIVSHSSVGMFPPYRTATAEKLDVARDTRNTYLARQRLGIGTSVGSSPGRKLVPKAGLEPARLAPHAPQTCVSAIPPLRHWAGLYRDIRQISTSDQPAVLYSAPLSPERMGCVSERGQAYRLAVPAPPRQKAGWRG